MTPEHTSSGTKPTVADLDSDLQRLFDIDPSPEFVARVRTQIASRPMPAPSLWWSTSGLVVLASAAAIVVAAVLLRPHGLRPHDERSSISAHDVQDATTRPALSRGSVPDAMDRGSSGAQTITRSMSTVPAGDALTLSIQRSRRSDAEVLVSQSEMKGLRRLIDLASQGDSGLDSLLAEPAAPDAVADAASADIVIPPIAIDPLVSDTY